MHEACCLSHSTSIQRDNQLNLLHSIQLSFTLIPTNTNNPHARHSSCPRVIEVDHHQHHHRRSLLFREHALHLTASAQPRTRAWHFERPKRAGRHPHPPPNNTQLPPPPPPSSSSSPSSPSSPTQSTSSVQCSAVQCSSVQTNNQTTRDKDRKIKANRCAPPSPLSQRGATSSTT